MSHRAHAHFQRAHDNIVDRWYVAARMRFEFGGPHPIEQARLALARVLGDALLLFRLEA